MPSPTPHDARLARLRKNRVAPERDVTMAFLQKQFKSQVERPYKQLRGIVEVWEQLVPPDVAAHTTLEGLNRGVLRVAVDSSSRLYELDRLLREGLEHELIKAFKGPAFRRVQLVVGSGNRP